MDCVSCIHCSLDGIVCHLHHRPTEPDGTCPDHADGGELLTALRSLVMSKTTKK